MTPSNAFQAAVYTALNTNAALVTLIGANHVFDFVPENATPPYVVIGDDTSLDWGTKTDDGWEVTATVHAWDFEKAGRKSVKAVLSAVYDALHRREDEMTLSGFNLVQVRCEFEQTFQDPSVEGQNDHFYHGVQRYRALVEEAVAFSAGRFLLEDGGNLLLENGGRLTMEA